MVRDPVCGMELEKNKIHSKLAYKGKEYYFCSASCEGLFKKINGMEAEEKDKTDTIEKKMIAYNTLKQLAVTIAHYIRNANTAISSQVQLCSEAADQKASQQSIEIIRRQSEKIESIISALLSISDIKLQKYVGSEEDAILDLRNTLEDKI